jgi:hypothetical protein
MLRKIILLALCFVIWCGCCLATPAPYTDNRCMFLGYDDDYYYYISIEQRCTGSYYSDKEIVNLFKQAYNGTVAEKIVLGGKIYSQNAEDLHAEWTYEILERDNEKIANYFTEGTIFYPQYSDYYKIRKIDYDYRFIIDADGIWIVSGTFKEIIILADALDPFVTVELESEWTGKIWQPSFHEYVGGGARDPLKLFAGEDYVFLLIPGHGTDSGMEIIVPISMKSLREMEADIANYFEE